MRKAIAAIIYIRTFRSTDQKKTGTKYIKLDQNNTKSNKAELNRNAFKPQIIENDDPELRKHAPSVTKRLIPE